ncbi:MAG: hypothetical protein BroJett030_13990 [Alphaproteobacteria bacterium]|nr:MAG: hypothetical protein BroJett030_13990 [Alphaproteobacteria bacterium]
MDKVLIGEILDPEPGIERARRRERRVRSGFWRTVRLAARRIPFMEDVVASYYCALDPRTPARTRAVLIGALAYFVLPTDFVPDFIAGFGFTDDIAVLTAALAAVRGALNDAHYSAARRALADPDAQNDEH